MGEEVARGMRYVRVGCSNVETRPILSPSEDPLLSPEEPDSPNPERPTRFLRRCVAIVGHRSPWCGQVAGTAPCWGPPRRVARSPFDSATDTDAPKRT